MRVIFGGPDKPPGLLRDELMERIAAVPAGGEVLWATYYLRSTALADALVDARRRGVGVRVCLEASPRLAGANDAVRRRLQGPDGLGSGFRAVSHLLPAHLHSKIYIFSHPVPVALVGSFNPSGGDTDEPGIIDEIGDQDRGHNYLVEITDTGMVQSLRDHVAWLHRSRHGLMERFAAAANASPRSDALGVYFFPRRRSTIVAEHLRQPGIEQVRIAASHFRDRSVAKQLSRLAAGGAQVEVLAHHTQRRVPERIARSSNRSGVAFWRYHHPQELPMHSKFVLIRGQQLRQVLFGSMNLTRTSRWLNHEVLVQSGDPGLFAAFDERWQHMRDEAQQFGSGCA